MTCIGDNYKDDGIITESEMFNLLFAFLHLLVIFTVMNSKPMSQRLILTYD